MKIRQARVRDNQELENQGLLFLARRRSLAASKIGSIAKKLGDQTKKVDQKLKNLRDKGEKDEFEELKNSLSSRSRLALSSFS